MKSWRKDARTKTQSLRKRRLLRVLRQEPQEIELVGYKGGRVESKKGRNYHGGGNMYKLDNHSVSTRLGIVGRSIAAGLRFSATAIVLRYLPPFLYPQRRGHNVAELSLH